MRAWTRAVAPVFLAALATTAMTSSHSPGDGPTFDLSWHTIDGGGGISGGSGFEVRGTIGQHDTGAAMISGDLELVPGFWGVPVRTARCFGDLDGSGDVGFGDVLAIIAAWGPCAPTCPEDLSGNGSVDFADILATIAAWGPCPP